MIVSFLTCSQVFGGSGKHVYWAAGNHDGPGRKKKEKKKKKKNSK